MKKSLLIAGILAGVGLLLVVACGGAVAVLVGSAVGAISAAGKPADEFLAKLGSGDTTGAYQSGASGLRATETPETFTAFVKSSRLDQYQASHWNKFNVVNSQSTVEGTVTLKDGSTVPLKVNLVNEGGWKVLGIELTGGAGTTITTPATAPARPTVPAEAELKKLVNRDMGEFRKALRDDDFTRFHARMSAPFREQKTADGLKDTFQMYRGKEEVFAGVDGIDPTLTKAATLDADGVLKVEGEYPLRPRTVVFIAKYVSEAGEWRLLGFFVKLNTAD